MKNHRLGYLVFVIMLSGCASKSSEISANFISPVIYQNYTCEQLGVEAQTVSRQAAIASGQQDKIAHGDAVKTTVAAVVFWPVLFLNKGDGVVANNVANLKGQMQAIQQASIEKNCGFVFQQ
jgi:hypothetical protein